MVGRKPKPLGENAHPLVRFIHENAEEKFDAIASLAGIDRQTITTWRLYGGNPRLLTIEAVLNAMGYDLVPVKRVENK
jgi:DNA-binding phage protein